MTDSTHTEPSPSRSAVRKGYVYIAGAGPGDPELLTLKADRVLREADVILFDDLVLPQMLEPYKAEKIYTGKRKDAHHFAQDEINQEIVRHALMGKTVVRLKGGDPFIFGRGGEEIETLFEARDVVAQHIDVPCKLFQQRPRGNQRALFGPVRGSLLEQASCAVLLPAQQGIAGARDAVGQNVAEHAAQVFFDIPAEVARDVIQRGGEFGVAFGLDVVPHSCVARREAQQVADECCNIEKMISYVDSMYLLEQQKADIEAGLVELKENIKNLCTGDFRRFVHLLVDIGARVGHFLPREEKTKTKARRR